MALNVLFQVYLVYHLYLAYGWPSLFGMFRTGGLVLTCALWVKVMYLTPASFKVTHLDPKAKGSQTHQE